VWNHWQIVTVVLALAAVATAVGGPELLGVILSSAAFGATIAQAWYDFSHHNALAALADIAGLVLGGIGLKAAMDLFNLRNAGLAFWRVILAAENLVAAGNETNFLKFVQSVLEAASVGSRLVRAPATRTLGRWSSTLGFMLGLLTTVGIYRAPAGCT
jgi:hypothetical protein